MIEYSNEIRRSPNTEDLEPMSGITVGALVHCFNGNVDEAVKGIREEYQGIRNDAFADARSRAEQCLFRLYEAQYLILPHVEVDLRGFVFDDAYHAFAVEKAAECYDRARGEQEYALALAAVKEKDYVTAGTHFRAAALCGHAGGQYNYGVSLSSGELGEADPLEGAFWYFIAAKNGNEKAMINLAVAYRNGMGVFGNGPMMLYWYARAAAIPNPYGVYNLGLCLQKEEVLDGNPAMGRNLRVAAERLNDESARQYAVNAAEMVLMILDGIAFNK